MQAVSQVPSAGPKLLRRGIIGVLTVLAAVVAASAARPATVVVVSGHGWGHGVGMSQWGARGYALHGWRWQQILGHYYPGTQVSTTANVRVRVLLAASQPSVSVGCPGGMRVSDATGRTYPLPAGTYDLGPGLKLPVGLHAKVRPLPSPVAFDCPSAPLEWNGAAYHGVLVVHSGGGKLAVVDAVDLEDYVRGVVGGEMPWHWPLAALEAQAVAARSYALATLHPTARFDLYADDRSQEYGGIGYETANTIYACQQTYGHILTYGGRVATTYFFASSGGRTADVRDVWPKLGDVPYLRSVADPYDAGSPVHAWARSLSAQVLTARLRASFGDVRVVRTTSGRVASVEIGSTKLSGDEFMRRLRLRSTWFSVGELTLTDGPSSVVYGHKVRLVARADGVAGALLQRRRGAGEWVTLKHVASGAHVDVEPREYTIYRLTAGRVRGPEVAVSVAPRVRVHAASAALIAGAVEPRSSGSVTVLRFVGDRWRVVARPQLDGRGAFRTPLRLRPGSYRVTVAAAEGLEDATAPLRVTSRLLAGLAAPRR
jgi:stage II sporulation protein D